MYRKENNFAIVNIKLLFAHIFLDRAIPNPMKTQEQIEKIQAVVLYILQQFPDGVDYVKLFKIMYFAQRKYLSTYGLCLVEDTFKARPRGPVPALTCKVLKMVEIEESFDETVGLEDFAGSVQIRPVPKECQPDQTIQMVYAKAAPDMDEIANMERKVLDETIAEYKDIPSEELSDLSHKDKAYKKARRMMRKDPQQDRLTYIDIAWAGGASEDVLEYIRESEQIKRDLAS